MAAVPHSSIRASPDFVTSVEKSRKGIAHVGASRRDVCPIYVRAFNLNAQGMFELDIAAEGNGCRFLSTFISDSSQNREGTGKWLMDGRRDDKGRSRLLSLS